MAACNNVDFPLLFGPASKVSGSSGKSCVSNRLKYLIVILVIIGVCAWLKSVSTPALLFDDDERAGAVGREGKEAVVEGGAAQGGRMNYEG